MQESEAFFRFLAQTSPEPLGIEITHADGAYLYGPEGEYIDFISGISVMNAGHRHPKVLEAIASQLDKHLHVMAYGEYIQKPVNSYAQYLTSLLPKTLNCVYFVNSGTEAIEAAIKLAKRHTGRMDTVSMLGSYHGNTQGALSVSGNEYKKQAFRPLIPGARFIRFNNEQDLDQISNMVAAVIVEPVQGDAGVILPNEGYLKKLHQKCRETGALLIFDEVQTGCGRTGSMFAFEQFDVVPDILCLAKALGGGLPLGAFVADKALMDDLTHDPMLGHITTFGGNPLSCVAGEAALRVVEGELQDIESKGQLIEELLQHPQIVDIRRIGMMIAIEFKDEDLVQSIVKKTISSGVITYFFLSNRNSFRIAPPLTISEQDIRKACDIIQSVFVEVLE